MKGIFIFSLALLTIGVSCRAQSQEPFYWGGQMRSSGYEIEIISEGRTLPTYQLNRQSFIEGRIGERYIIRIHNNTWRRIEALVSVDGRDAIDGRPASINKRGYVIPAYSFIDIDGFRLNMSEVAAFRFTTVDRSYAARTGTPWTVGVIGAAIFPEYVSYPPPHPRPPYTMREDDRSGRLSRDGVDSESRGKTAEEPTSPPSTRNLGTEFGERRASPVSETAFLRENWNNPAARLTVRYDDSVGLCAIGLGAYCASPYQSWPPPYEVPQNDRFSTPPPGWEHFTTWY